jgi:hypothetical protein
LISSKTEDVAPSPVISKSCFAFLSFFTSFNSFTLFLGTGGPRFWDRVLTAPCPAACKTLALRSLANWVAIYNRWQAVGEWKPGQAPHFFNAPGRQNKQVGRIVVSNPDGFFSERAGREGLIKTLPFHRIRGFDTAIESSRLKDFCHFLQHRQMGSSRRGDERQLSTSEQLTDQLTIFMNFSWLGRLGPQQ